MAKLPACPNGCGSTETNDRGRPECPRCGWSPRERRKQLPILGEQPLPVALRPDCRGCGVKLKPNIGTKWASDERGWHHPTHRAFDGSYGLHNLFHSKDCAYAFALTVARRGARIGY